ncbi:NADAR family protein [Sulfitobacter sp. R18_1]|uniref:NADAR family protein n=1 Tax=Sulfitobacter sp. R18_1 TaxID=2821104 RepID=UPI001ADC8757|nr:NADAR family protein [Sulfitobacter sp. R18_1]
MNQAQEIRGLQGPYRFLSNFHSARVTMYGVEFPTNEHAYQAAKMPQRDLLRTQEEWLKDLKAFAQIETAKKAKRAGRTLRMRDDWDEVKYGIMLELTRRKYVRHPLLAGKLLNTGTAYIWELNDWDDTYWGVIEEGGKLIGENNLGKILMQVRKELNGD